MRRPGSLTRNEFLKAIGAAALLPVLPGAAAARFSRRRPADALWPSPAAWRQLDKAVGGNLLAVQFPLSALTTDPSGAAASQVMRDLRNPYYVGDQPGLSQTLGWVDAWTSRPSVYAVAARNARDIAAAVNFARDNDLRLVVKGGGHSYQGTSNAPDSLLIWTRRMHDITLHAAFVPQGCAHAAPLPAVTLGAGTTGMQAYDAVTTRSGKYVQGGGCTTVGLAGLVQGGGFGSYSKHYGLAAGSLLEAEVVTADGAIRIANACSNPDLFWALKGGGGGTFGVVSRMTLRLHDLPDFFSVASFTIKAASDDAYRRLIGEFIRFYAEHLLNHHWGEQAHVSPDNTLGIQMNAHGLNAQQAKQAWQPFLDWVTRSKDAYSFQGAVTIGSVPARHWWDVQWWKANWPEIVFAKSNRFIALFDDALAHVLQPVLDFDNRPGAASNNAWWSGDGDQVAQFLWAYESLWLPQTLLAKNTQQQLAAALFASSRHAGVGLHFNKGLAGAPSEALARSRETATNPAVLDAFALAITGAGEGPAYPGIPGHEPGLERGRIEARIVRAAMAPLMALPTKPASYVSETDYFKADWQQAFWGEHYARLQAVKRRYDPDGLFFVHHSVGSEGWSGDGFTRTG